jgi:UDP-N-acetylmuramoyl-tripeptide--D-alanyl-D-alanine ligase
MHLSISEIYKLLPKAMIRTSIGSIHSSTRIKRTYIDTRNIDSTDIDTSCFFALKGEYVDGNRFIQNAFEIGVSLCIGTLSLSELQIPSGATYIQVTDTLLALQALATKYRVEKLAQVTIVGVTGSVGKTTVKDMLTGALSPLYPASTKGNLNNHIGVPLSILDIHPETKYAVLEAGMNHRGEMEVLAKIMQPDIVLITKIGVAHIEHLKTQDEIAREKSDLALYSPRAKLVLIPAEDIYADFIETYISNEIQGVAHDNINKTISVEKVDTSHAHLASTTLSQHSDIHTYTIPAHIQSMICLVASCARKVFYLAGVRSTDKEIIERILQSHITPRRFELKEIAKGITLVDDSYNANPDSMRANLKAFDDICAEKIKTGLPQKSIVILGGMAELGEQSEWFHQETCTYIQTLKHIDTVISVGDLAKQYAFPERILHCADIHIAYEKIIKSISISDTDNTYLFIKGSKSTHMSDLADMLTKYFENTVK